MPRPIMITRTFNVAVCTVLTYNEKSEETAQKVFEVVKPFSSNEKLLQYLKDQHGKTGIIPIKILDVEYKKVLKGMTPEYFFSQSKELENRNNKVKERKKKK